MPSSTNTKHCINVYTLSIKPDVARMMQEMAALSKQSNDLFNPTIGHLINTWGFQSDAIKPSHIDAEKIEQLVASKPSMADLVITGDKVYSQNPAVKLDLGGYAKGYALDLGLAYLREQQIEHALINIGGNTTECNRNHRTKKWLGYWHLWRLSTFL